MRLPHGKIIALRESPSGKASAFQADIRGFESRLPLFGRARFPCAPPILSARADKAAGLYVQAIGYQPR